mmetsp:Transcript_23211/g.72722  ORF Transcript_23211/g.72722 Transcript_23211/m.72722 type:complete len:225 (+) Transcript_23211:1110-1784(+)
MICSDCVVIRAFTCRSVRYPTVSAPAGQLYGYRFCCGVLSASRADDPCVLVVCSTAFEFEHRLPIFFFFFFFLARHDLPGSNGRPPHPRLHRQVPLFLGRAHARLCVCVCVIVCVCVWRAPLPHLSPSPSLSERGEIASHRRRRDRSPPESRSKKSPPLDRSIPRLSGIPPPPRVPPPPPGRGSSARSPSASHAPWGGGSSFAETAHGCAVAAPLAGFAAAKAE